MITARDPEDLPNLLRVRASGPLSAHLSWPSRSGCALQCVYSLSPAGGGSRTLLSAEAVALSRTAEEIEIEIVKGWPGEPRYWGNRPVHDEEVEAAIHGLGTDDELVLLSDPVERDALGRFRARILQSEDDRAVLFIADSPERAWVLSGVVDRLCETGMLVRLTNDTSAPGHSQLARTSFRRTAKEAPLVTRWLGGYGTRAQQAVERGTGAPWPVPDRWPAGSP